MSVRANVAFGGRERVDELLERLGIAQLAREKPGRLSGGERQRVAVARALARDPSVLLLDEPLSALDAHTRIEVREQLADVLAELAIPALIVTHDFTDAAALAPRVGVVLDGRLHQLGTPAELLARPADAFVASLTGGNLLLGHATAAADGGSERAARQRRHDPLERARGGPRRRGDPSLARQRRARAAGGRRRTRSRARSGRPRCTAGATACASASCSPSAPSTAASHSSAARRHMRSFAPEDVRLVPPARKQEDST